MTETEEKGQEHKPKYKIVDKFPISYVIGMSPINGGRSRRVKETSEKPTEKDILAMAETYGEGVYWSRDVNNDGPSRRFIVVEDKE